jgi:hypothetical protein
VTSLAVGPRGVRGVVYRAFGYPRDFSDPTERILGQMETGALRADAIDDYAIELRQGKHADPVRGVIGAYLYDALGDTDSIRRMAYFYVMHRQAIPYDIALLAQLTGRRRDKALLWADVPAVQPRKPRSGNEAQHHWTHSGTPAAEGAVAGLWPWLRQGWSYLDDPRPDGSTLVLPGLPELADELTTGRFATLTSSGGKRLAELFGLRPQRGR